MASSAAAAGGVGVVAEGGGDGEDEVVRELPVYLSHCEGEDMRVYLMQYPLRPPNNPYALEEQCEGVRIKPNQCKIEIEIGLQEQGPNYDRNAEQHLKIKTQTLKSAPVPSRASYAVGLMTDSALHLVPVHVAVQLRPSLMHLDEADEKRRLETDKEKKKKGEVEDEDDDNSNVQLTPLQMQIKRRETERQAELRMHSHAYLKQREEEEKWVDLEAYGADSETSAALREQLCTTSTAELPFHLPRQTYLASIVPPAEEAKPKPGSEMILTKQYLESLPLDARVQAIFARGSNQILWYDKVKKLCPPDSKEEDILKALEKWAVLVQGCWVASSILRCEGDVQRYQVRDMFLQKFTDAPAVPRREIERLAADPHHSMETIRAALSGIATHNQRKGVYEFKESPDTAFLAAHPEMVERQKDRWDNAGTCMQPEALALAGDAADAGGLPLTTRMSPLVMESLKVVILVLLKERRVCSLRRVRQWLQTDPRAGTAVQAAEAFDHELLSLFKEVAVVINNTVILPELGDPTLDPFRNMLIGMYEKKKSLKKAEIVAEAAKTLGVEVPTSVYNKVLKDLCVTKGGEWHLRSGDEIVPGAEGASR